MLRKQKRPGPCPARLTILTPTRPRSGSGPPRHVEKKPHDFGFCSSLRVRGIAGNEQKFQSPVPVIITSLRDDSAGVRGPSDTNNVGTNTVAAAGDWGMLEVGAWAKNFGRLSPLNGAGLSQSVFNSAQFRFGSTGILLQSQSPEISSTVIRGNG